MVLLHVLIRKAPLHLFLGVRHAIHLGVGIDEEVERRAFLPRFEMGFPIPTKRGEGVVGGYHCWAWFYPNQKGWIPVDISEANRNPELKEYYFGNLTEDRVRFTTGRDINLEPRQKGPALNFFIYPYAEVAGKVHPQEKMERRFAYQDVK